MRLLAPSPRHAPHRRRLRHAPASAAAPPPAPPAAAPQPWDDAVVDGVTIRRRPPGATASDLAVGSSFDFKLEALSQEKGHAHVDDAANKPRNILEARRWLALRPSSFRLTRQPRPQEIVWYKAVEIARWKVKESLEALKRQSDAQPPPRDFVGALRAARAAAGGLPALIAEVKKASPSKGVLSPDFDAARIAAGYAAGGAACLSVLTDEKFFQGSFENLRTIRAAGVNLPLLAKEFIVEPYQLFKARAHGADAVLLIAAVLPNADLKYLARIAASLRLAILIEVHTEAELDRVVGLQGEHATTGGKPFPEFMLGINNRDLETFVVDIHNTPRLLATPSGVEALRRGTLVVGESGVFTREHMGLMQSAGVEAVLVGEAIVKGDDQAGGVRRLYGRE